MHPQVHPRAEELQAAVLELLLQEFWEGGLRCTAPPPLVDLCTNPPPGHLCGALGDSTCLSWGGVGLYPSPPLPSAASTGA